jgi:hypothetical protein
MSDSVRQEGRRGRWPIEVSGRVAGDLAKVMVYDRTLE